MSKFVDYYISTHHGFLKVTGHKLPLICGIELYAKQNIIKEWEVTDAMSGAYIGTFKKPWGKELFTEVEELLTRQMKYGYMEKQKYFIECLGISPLYHDYEDERTILYEGKQYIVGRKEFDDD